MAPTAAGLAVVGAWRTPAGLLVGTAIFAIGIALLTPAVLTLAVQGGGPRERGRGARHHLGLPRPGLGPRPGHARPGRRDRPAGRVHLLGGAAVAAAGLLLVRGRGPTALRAGR